MRILVPYDDSALARHALREACRIMTPLDAVIVMATVIVPPALPVDVPAGEIWRQTCRAEVQIAHARGVAARYGCDGAEIRSVRIQTADSVAAVIAAATSYAADTILLAESAGLRSRLAALFGREAAIIRRAPCDIRVVYMQERSRQHERRGARRSVPAECPEGALRHG